MEDRKDEFLHELKRRRLAEQKEAAQAELARRSLAHFLRAVWPTLEKKDELLWGPHLDALCIHLQNVESKNIHNLAISLPPGCLTGDTIVPVRMSFGWQGVPLGFLAEDKKKWEKSPPLVARPDGKGGFGHGLLKDAWFSGVKETFKVRTASGRQVRGTADHPVLVQSSVSPVAEPVWVKLGELVPGDRLCVDAGTGRVEGDPVTSVVQTGRERVFDLEMADEPHAFIGNGIVLSNCTKTKLVMEAFPAWLLGRDPTRRILCVSNSERLATKSSLSCRDIIKSDWYRKYFPDVQIADDQDTKVTYRTTQGGYRMSKPMMSRIIGEKADFILVDDPNDAEQVLSQANADNVRTWYERALHNRVNSFQHSCRVAIAQRTSKRDLIGFLTESFGYEYLFLPEEFEPERRFTSSIGWTDWRTEAGELLRPQQFGPEQVAIERRRPYYRSYHQQDPDSAEHAFFKPEWFQLRWRHGPTMGSIILPSADPKEPDYHFDSLRCVRFATIDAAASAKTSADHTACTVFVLSPRGDLVVLDCILRQVDIPDQPKVLAEIQRKHAPPVLGIERAGANAAMYQFAVRMGFTCVPLEPKGRDKLVRAQPAIIRASQGKLWLPTPGSVPDFDTEGFLAELVAFTGVNGRGRDDIVDTVSLAHELLPYLSQVAIGRAGQPQAVAIDGGAGRYPGGSVLVPPVGGRSGANMPATGGRAMPSVVRPSSPFGR